MGEAQFKCEAKISEDKERMSISLKVEDKMHLFDVPVEAGVLMMVSIEGVVSGAKGGIVCISERELTHMSKCTRILAGLVAQQGGSSRVEKSSIASVEHLSIQAINTWDDKGFQVTIVK